MGAAAAAVTDSSNPRAAPPGAAHCQYAGGLVRKLVLVALAAAILAGCASQETQPEAPIDDKGAAGATATPGTTTAPLTGGAVGGSGVGSGAAGAGGAGAAALRDPNNILSKRSIYFEYDSFVVQEQYKPIVEAHARYLVANRGARATLQGHADERGSREYNIALGQKRADAVKRMMTLLGAQEVQIETVSFGEEKPKNMGHDESAWTENRRVDIVHAGE
jgi:peptidoglycan-associated lipoprotein